MFRNTSTNEGGEITFGGINKDRFTGPISYVPVNKNTNWQFTLDNILDKSDHVVACESNCYVSILISFPFNIIKIKKLFLLLILDSTCDWVPRNLRL